MAYSGHQFGHFSPELGDGRAILLGSIKAQNGIEYYIQLKGSGGIITRVSKSFVRVGTFQYFSSRNDLDSIRKLDDYVIARNYPEIMSSKNQYQNLLKEVINRQAKLIAKWMGLVFIHGVMNTDNMSICGETIDYGPCAFMDDFSFNKKFSFIDEKGYYAYNNQPHIALWDLTRFAESILSLLSDDQTKVIKIAEDALNNFPNTYEKYWLTEMQGKLGFAIPDLESTNKKHKEIIDDLLNLMAESKTDFTLTFYTLTH